MEALPSELVLNVIRFVPEVQDKCQISITCRRMHNLLRNNPWCWSPLDLSRHGDRITNSVLVTILRNCSIPIILAGEAKTKIPTYDPFSTIQEANLSGCWCLTPEAISMLACSLPQLTALELNRYGGTAEIWPFEQRDHLYQMRPSHNLSSLAMDMSKVPSMSLSVSEATLQYILGRCTRIVSLSLRYQSLGIDGCRAIGSLHNLRHLDISSCAITQPVLQMLLRKSGRRLVSLKMLNIDLTNLTLLCMQQHAQDLKLLHLSCQEPQVLAGIVRMLERLHQLEDFRLTQLRTGGNVDLVVGKLNAATVRRLDLSPKLDFHPRSPRLGTRLVSPVTPPPGARRRRSSSPHDYTNTRMPYLKPETGSPPSPLPRTEHHLNLTDRSLATLTSFKGLVELRLCYPVVSTAALTALFACAQNLEILELRMEMRRSSSRGQKEESILVAEQCEEDVDVLRGLLPSNVPKLQELSLYHSWISVGTARTLCSFPRLRDMTIYNCGRIADREPEIMRRWLVSIESLRLLRLGRAGQIRCDLLDDVATARDTQPKHVSRYDDEFTFIYRSHRQWEWHCSSS
ncbi:hypothetical protein BJV82DRAFT_604510 [Fennellomyces sp. T-0311]|nr:hypothetical protein BJV82DRAFT_604510 [Fennellomyces sp. T-0311]